MGTLHRYDNGQLALPSGEAQVVTESVGNEELNLKFSEEEMAAAETFLDELLKSNDMDLNFSDVEVQNLQDTTTEDQGETIAMAELEQQQPVQVENSKVLNLTPVGSFKIENQNDSGFFDMSNVTEVFTEDGRQIIIMVAPPSPTPTKMTWTNWMDGEPDDSEMGKEDCVAIDSPKDYQWMTLNCTDNIHGAVTHWAVCERIPPQ